MGVAPPAGQLWSACRSPAQPGPHSRLLAASPQRAQCSDWEGQLLPGIPLHEQALMVESCCHLAPPGLPHQGHAPRMGRRKVAVLQPTRTPSRACGVTVALKAGFLSGRFKVWSIIGSISARLPVANGATSWASAHLQYFKFHKFK